MEKQNLNSTCSNLQSDDDKTVGDDGSPESSAHTSSFSMKWKDPVYREKLLYSMIMTASYLALGMCVGQHGPTFLDIQVITNTTLEEASAFFTGNSAGRMMGCIITGIVYNKLNIPLLLFFTSLGVAVTDFALPHCTQFELMLFMRFLSAVFVGSNATGINTQHMAVWGANGNGLLQLLHFGFSVGAMASPLFAEPFLLEKVTDAKDITTGNETHSQLNISKSHLASESRVKYVFYITGCFILVTAIPYLYIYFSHREKNNECVIDKSRKFSQRNAPFKLLIFMLSGVCLFTFVRDAVEPTFFDYLMTFLVEEYKNISKSKGAFITSLVWGTFAITRFLLIFLARKFTPFQLLFCLATIMVFSYSAFSIFAYFKIVDGIIVFAAMSSIMMAGMFPVSLSWVETELFHVTGLVGSSILVTHSLGGIVNPMILGALMDKYSNMWFCYLLLIQTSVSYLIFVSLIMFSRCYVDRKYGTLAASSVHNQEQEISISAELVTKGCDAEQNPLQ